MEFKSSLEKGENYFSDTGLVILDVIKKDSIVKAVFNLIEKKYFNGQKRLNVEPAEKWFFIEL